MTQAAQVWAKYVNSRGGLNGHRVDMLMFDDGGDQARHRALVQQAVERYHVLAFLMNGGNFTGESSVKYITEKRIPVIGLNGAESWAYTSPMYFPQIPAGALAYEPYPPAIARQLVPKGKSKTGTIVCVESPACPEFERVWEREAKKVGLEYVYKGKSSIGQPDFTAECLSAHNAGAEILFVLLDGSSLNRVATACSRQGYRPTYAMSGPAIDSNQAKNPELNGLVASTPLAPWFQQGTPATEEYRQAMSAYGKDIRPYNTMWGWAAGKLLEKAAMKLPEPPTTEAILAGLWSLKDDTLGGLTAPLTFVKDQPPQGRACGFDLRLENSEWLSPDNFTLHCP